MTGQCSGCKEEANGKCLKCVMEVSGKCLVCGNDATDCAAVDVSNGLSGNVPCVVNVPRGSVRTVNKK